MHISHDEALNLTASVYYRPKGSLQCNITFRFQKPLLVISCVLITNEETRLSNSFQHTSNAV